MVAIDMIGLILTICLVGVRYPHLVLLAALIHEFGRIVIAIILHGHIESVIAAGAFGSTIVSHQQGSLISALIIFGGPLANYIVSSTAGGIEFERTAALLNSGACLKHPFAVVNLRLALVSVLVNIWQFL